MNIKSLKRGHKIALILIAVSILLTSQIKPVANFIQLYIPYNYLLLITFIIILIEYSYLLLYKNHVEELEEENKFLKIPKTVTASSDSNSNAGEKEIPQEEFTLKPSEIHDILTNLSGKEKEFLRRFLIEDSRTLKIDMTNSTADGLRRLGILTFDSQFMVRNLASYSISYIYWVYIKNHPKVIDYKLLK